MISVVNEVVTSGLQLKKQDKRGRLLSMQTILIFPCLHYKLITGTKIVYIEQHIPFKILNSELRPYTMLRFNSKQF